MQETKSREDQFPYLTFEALGYQVAHVGFNQWNGVAIASRVGLDDVQVGFENMPGWGEPVRARPGAWAPRSATCASGRSMSRTAQHRRPAHALQGRLAAPASRRGQGPGSTRTRRRDRADGRLEHRAVRRGRVEHGVSTRTSRTSRRRSGRPSRASSTRDTPTSSARCAPVPAPTPTGTTSGSGSRDERVCESTSSSARPPSPPGQHAEIVREERKGKNPSDHAPVLVVLS
jgi:exodeoxyribonuclease-3